MIQMFPGMQYHLTIYYSPLFSIVLAHVTHLDVSSTNKPSLIRDQVGQNVKMVDRNGHATPTKNDQYLQSKLAKEFPTQFATG